MTRIIFSIICIISVAGSALAADPTATTYSWDDCQGTYKPYSAPAQPLALPDSLKPVMINHVGRHGARYPSSPSASTDLRRILTMIDEQCGGLTETGRRLLALTDRVIETASGRWGSLSQLGMAEQRGIASRLFKDFRPLFSSGRVNAISSYSPRCIMSMYEFAHQLSRLDNRIDVTTSSGRSNSPTMRFFDNSPLFTSFLESEELAGVQKGFDDNTITTEPLKRLAKGDIDAALDAAQQRNAVMDEFTVLTGLQSFGLSCDPGLFFTPAEQNALWSVSNMKHYLRRSDSVLSAVPADIAAPLLDDIIATFDAFIADSAAIAPVQLRFGHAETLMPLLALMHIEGCYYLTNYFETVGLHWRDFYVAPMAANLQLILLRAKSGELYLLTRLNEQSVSLIPNTTTAIVPWAKAREYLMKCLPFDYGVSPSL